jgi:4-amino-4-deoxy-L-arabinose transferase-like glycosyltransferase
MKSRFRLRREGALLIGILAVATILRTFDLASLPPAHYRDVALTALDAMRAASGHPHLHYTYDEGLYANLMGLLFLVFDPSDWAVRLPGVLIGVLTCWGVYRLGRALDRERAGLYGTALLAICLWHLVLSRSGFRAVMLPMLLVHSAALLVEGIRRGSGWRIAAGGALLGLGVHVYPAIRFAPLIFVVYLATEIGAAAGERRRRRLRGVLLFAGAALIVASPMLVHYLHHPEHFTYPHRVVSVFSPKLAPGEAIPRLLQNVPATLMMFHVRGDMNWRHNVPGAPLLDPLAGILLLVGVASICRRREERPAAALLLAWVPAMLLPNLLSVEGVPHGLRSCGTLPALMLLAGLGLDAASAGLERLAGARWTPRIVLVLLLLSGSWTSWRYFAIWGRDPRMAEAHDAAFRAAANVLLASPPGTARILVANGVGYEAYGRPAEVHPFLFEMREAKPEILGPGDTVGVVLEGRPARIALIRRDRQVLGVIRLVNPGATIREIEAPGLSSETPVLSVNENASE